MRKQQEINKNIQCNILIICQLQSQDTISLVKDTIEILLQCNNVRIFTQSSQIFPKTSQYKLKSKLSQVKIDYTICIGENSTLLRVFSAISNNHKLTSPVVSISNGTQPIICSYQYCDLEKVIRNLMQIHIDKKIRCKNSITMDLVSQSKKQIIKSFSGELQIHRGMKQGVVKLNIYIRSDQEKDFMILASLWGDGLILSTPLGSTGRSMALNGPIIHKNLECIMIVPVCPLSLNFRPIILPAETQILIEVDKSSRFPAKLFVDSEQLQDLPQSERIVIRKGNKRTQVVTGLTQISSSQNWILSLHNVINWAELFGAKSPPPKILRSSINIKEKQKQKQLS